MTQTNNLFIGIGGWASGTYAVGDMRSSAGNGYQCIRPGTSTGAPTGNGTLINNGGTAYWTFCAAIDFTDLPTAQAALPGTFTQPIIWQFFNCGPITTTLGTPFVQFFAGTVTSTTNNLTLTPAPGHGIRDALRRGVSPLALNSANGVTFQQPVGVGNVAYNYVGIANVAFDGLQFQDPTSNSASAIINGDTGSTGLIIRNCVIDGYGQVGDEMVYLPTTGALIANTMMIDRQAAGVNGRFVNFDTSGTGKVINSALVAVNNPGGSAVGILVNGGAASVTARNLALFGYGSPLVCQNITGAIVVDHCCTDVAAFDASTAVFACTDNGGELFSKSASNQFVSATSDFRYRPGSDFLNAGATDATDIPTVDDIARTKRPQGTAWDIGPIERPAPFALRRSPTRLRL